MVVETFNGTAYLRFITQLRDPVFNRALAAYLNTLDRSADGIIDWCIEEVVIRHNGDLRDMKDRIISKRSIDVIDAFNVEDAGRWMRDYLKRPERGANTIRLQWRLVTRVAALDLARQIHEGRHGRPINILG